ncbi:villin-4-like [Corylus avellana]|uniref:villin-4-like n=1 Tax=Corylus avellana TaxID=13451 RepID=UPI00286B0A2D|nr:villin-4-like [Corylus avellana]
MKDVYLHRKISKIISFLCFINYLVFFCPSFYNFFELSLSLCADESLVSAASPAAEPRSPSQGVGLIQADGSGDCMNLLSYPYERLKVISSDPVAGIDVTKREAYLSDEEFLEKFGMTKRAFYGLPKWRQNKLKMSLDLF